MLPRTGRPPLFHWALVVVTGALGPVNQAGKPLRRSTFQGQTRVIAPKFFMQASFTAVNPPPLSLLPGGEQLVSVLLFTGCPREFGQVPGSGESARGQPSTAG